MKNENINPTSAAESSENLADARQGAAELIVSADKKEGGEAGDKAIAYTLWFFLGFCSAHRFWWGKWVTGIAQVCIPLIGFGLMLFAGIDLLRMNQNGGEALKLAGSHALIGAAVVLCGAIWVLLDAVLIAFWGPRKKRL